MAFRTGLTLRMGKVFALSCLGAVLALLAPAPLVATGTTTLAWTASITPDSNVSNADFALSFTGLDANSAIQISVQPVNLVVGDQFATADGTAQFTFKAPPSTPPGDYSVRAVGVSNSGSAFAVTVATFTVAPAGTVSGATVRDGILTLEMPSGVTATFQDPTREGGLSVTRGSLSSFVVRDDRAASKPGWVLTASVTPLALEADNLVTMPAAQLGITPLVLAGGAGIIAGQASVPGSAVYPMVFADSPAGVQASTTALGGNLALVASPQLPVGTYTGTLTLTLVSR